MPLKLKIAILLSAALVAGCSAGYRAQGQYYLKTQKYKTGLEAFKENVRRSPDNASANHYLGRFYLAENQPKAGLRYLRRSAKLNPEHADTFFWAGIAYSQLNNPERERANYLKALSLDPRHIQARTYLAHNQLERKKYTAALRNYNKILDRQPDHPAALYNRADILNRQGEKTKAKIALKRYLSHYPSGTFARLAVSRLNEMGDFGYRNYTIGRRTVTLKAIEFVTPAAEVSSASRPSLDVIGAILDNNRRISLNIVVYQKGNKKLAAARARGIKTYILKKFPAIEADRLQLSWFGLSEKIKTQRKKVFTAGPSVNFFSAKR